MADEGRSPRAASASRLLRALPPRCEVRVNGSMEPAFRQISM